MAIETIIADLAGIYREHFNLSAGDMRIKQVTENVPEKVTEWPHLFFVMGDGDSELMTFSSDVPKTRRRRQSLPVFGSAPDDETVRRPKVQLTHRFKAQLLVRPRRDLVEDESAARPFVQRVITLTAEHLDLDGSVEHCKPTGYLYGKFELGTVGEKVVEFIGIEFTFEAVEIV